MYDKEDVVNELIKATIVNINGMYQKFWTRFIYLFSFI